MSRSILAQRVGFFLPAFEAGPAPLYALLTRRAAVELDWPTNPFTLALEPFQEERPERFMWLRLLALVHRWVLAGELEELAQFYPSAGGTMPPSGLTWTIFRDAVVDVAPALPELLVSQETGMPTRLLEVGASAGLLLRWDHYLRCRWFRSMFEGEPPDVAGQAMVVERRGCDLHPVDATDADGALYLRSMVWADMVAHIHALDEAISISAQVPAQVDEADGADWLGQHGRPQSGAVTVIYHSLMRASGPPQSLSRIDEAVQRAGYYATPDAPVAYLRFEAPADARPGQDDPRRLVEVRLTTWPGSADRLLATSDVNGRNVRWLL